MLSHKHAWLGIQESNICSQAVEHGPCISFTRLYDRLYHSLTEV